VKKLDPSRFAGEIVKWYYHFDSSSKKYTKNYIIQQFYPIHIYSKEMKHVHLKTWTAAETFLIAKKEKHPKGRYNLYEEWINMV
jgi:hypothetical protein